MNNGWVKLHRVLLNNPIANRPKYCHLWMHLLLMAAHQEVNIKKIWKGTALKLKPGQLFTGRKRLSERTGIPEGTIERILTYLQNEHQIEQQKTTKFRIITIKNWDKYQNQENSEQQNEQQNEQQADTYKNELKNEATRKNLYMDFVRLTDSEFEKLKKRFGEAGANERIAALNEGIGSKGYKYKSHFFTILSWERKNERKKGTGKTRPDSRTVDESYIR